MKHSYKSIGNASFKINDAYEPVSDEPSLTQPEATLSIQALMSNVIEYQRAYREGAYLSSDVNDNEAFGMLDVDAMDLCEIQELRDKINDKIKGRWTPNL